MEYAFSSTVSRESSQMLDKAGLGWQTVLAFTTMLFSGMQGVLVMESAEPCRISYSKLVVFLVLEFLEFLATIFAEVASFLELRSAFTTRLQWLSWMPYCLVIYGIFELLIDVVYTMYLTHCSRVRWIPFSSVARHEKGRSRLAKLIILVVSAVLSFFLIGWQQGWWMRTSSRVSREAAISSTIDEVFLSVWMMSVCVTWALLLLTFAGLCFFYRERISDVLYYVGAIDMTNEEKRKRAFKLLCAPRSERERNERTTEPATRAWCIQSCNIFKTCKEILWPYKSSYCVPEEETASVRNLWRLLQLLKQNGIDMEPYPADSTKYIRISLNGDERSANESDAEELPAEQGIGSDVGGLQATAGMENALASIDNSVDSYIRSAPLNVRNAILVPPNKEVNGNRKAAALAVLLLVVKYGSFLPLLICVVAAVGRLWNRVDFETFQTLKSLADTVIVISVVEIGINLKHMIWGIRSCDEHDTFNV
ncbi:hypothetical protein BWQ96_07076 [Gracilariopsis chorda]|uniref:Uncharacterized protein n=1 Tax=Gracilariopsis chorda TaxID=448386 RepID=A0A2V3IM96_9FLOR|nr:hypothetical protein BWQ96_07076 [Gracilariopsis chorda]|eukprot:PXF43201.1 hypothetical protein BWQ96_07076 [Gracilariopsis chorda]